MENGKLCRGFRLLLALSTRANFMCLIYGDGKVCLKLIHNVASILQPARPARTTTRATTTRRRKTTTTTLPPTTTTMPPTTTPTTTVPPTTTPTTTVPPTTTPIPTTTPMPTPLNCAEVAQRGETVSGSFLIDPMQNGNAFRAHCELPKGTWSFSSPSSSSFSSFSSFISSSSSSLDTIFITQKEPHLALGIVYVK